MRDKTRAIPFLIEIDYFRQTLEMRVTRQPLHTMESFFT